MMRCIQSIKLRALAPQAADVRKLWRLALTHGGLYEWESSVTSDAQGWLECHV
jgi:hypothetical protein